MSKIFFFCIPAWGHTNPTIPVVEELVKRGHQVRYYSFEMFREKIESTGAEFICCDPYLPEMTDEEMLKLLATDGMLVKRPLLVGDDFVLGGFRESDWDSQLK